MNLLKELMVDSHSGDYTGIASVISGFLKGNTDAEVSVQNVGPNKMNVIAKFGNPKLLINCHMDTVPPVGEWKYSPLTPTMSSGKIFGLGTADTKGNIYAVLKAVEKSQPKDLWLLFSTDEESGNGGSGVRKFLQAGMAKGIKAAIVLEPTSLAFVGKHKGYYAFKITVTAKPMHSSLQVTVSCGIGNTSDNSAAIGNAKNGSENAVAKAARIITKLDEAGFNIGAISGGGMGNVVASKCEFKTSLRTYNGLDAAKKMLAELIGNDGNVAFEAGFCGIPLDGCCDVAKFPQKIAELTSQSPAEAGFWTEAALFQDAGIPSLVFGAGNIQQAHSPDEFVEMEQLEKAQMTFQKIIGG